MKFADVLSEVYAAVMAMGKEYRLRIPDDVWDVIVVAKNDRYTPCIDENKALNEQGLSHDTVTFIAMLHRDYWCDTEEDRASLIVLFEKNEAELNEKISRASGLKELLKLIRKN